MASNAPGIGEPIPGLLTPLQLPLPIKTMGTITHLTISHYFMKVIFRVVM